MVDIKLIRENPQYYKDAVAAKQLDPTLVDELLKLDEERKALSLEVEELRAKRNTLAKEGKASEEGKAIKEALKAKEPALTELDTLFKDMLWKIPNPAKEDVKVGASDKENDVVRTWGDVRSFDFTPKDHLELGEHLGIIDTRRAANVSGARFAYLKGDGVLLEFALFHYALELLMSEGFVPVIPPVLIKKDSMRAMGYMEHGGEDDMFVLPNDNMVLVGTSEQSIGPMHMNETLDLTKPIRYAGISNCFRREAGSYGKDTRGILRVHQFDKVEMFSFTTAEKSDEEHEYLLSLEEKLLQGLGLSYQVVKMCTGDLGLPAARKYDLEAWIPTQGKYRELTSTSTCTDFQARRLNTKYRDGAETKYAHMLNGTAFAMGRTIIAILENYQEADGSVKVPEVLVKWIGKDMLKA